MSKASTVKGLEACFDVSPQAVLPLAEHCRITIMSSWSCCAGMGPMLLYGSLPCAAPAFMLGMPHHDTCHDVPTKSAGSQASLPFCVLFLDRLS